MRQLLFILSILIPSFVFSQIPNINPRNIQLLYQTTGDGIVWRGGANINYTPTSKGNAWMHLDTVNNKLYSYVQGQWSLVKAGGVTDVYMGNDTLYITTSDTVFYTVITPDSLQYNNTTQVLSIRNGNSVTLAMNTDTTLSGNNTLASKLRVNNTYVPLFKDTLTTIATKANVILKLNIQDTTNMLVSYINREDTAAMLANYINVADTSLMLSSYINVADTASMLSNYINVADTSAMLSTYINREDTAAMLSTYVNIADTAAMLNNYVNIADTSAMLVAYINRVDTAAMLLPYLRKADTLTMLSTYINREDTLAMLSTYINREDTSSMLLPYLRKADTLAMLIPYINREDTASMLANYVNFIDTLTTIGTKANIALKQNIITGAATTITSSNLTPNRAVISDGSGKIAVSPTVDNVEISYLDGVTSSIQAQINTKLSSADTSKYIKYTDTVSTIATKANLTLKLNAADTASLSNRINLKLNASDTVKYIKYVDTLTSIATKANLNLKLNSADTASLSTRIDARVRYTDTTSLIATKANLTLKLNTADTLSLSNRINTKQDIITGAATTITSSNLTPSRALISNSAGKVSVSPTVDSTELGYLDGVTSSIQTQINSKQATITGAATTITSSNLTPSRALLSNTSGKVVASSTIDSVEIGYLDGVTSNIQTQLNAKQAQLNGTGFVKANGTAITYDDSAYLTSEVDGSVSNEGTLGVGAGSSTTAVITSNTSGANGVTITQGTGIAVTETTSTNGGTITITNSAPDQTVALTGSGATTVTGTYPNFTVGSQNLYTANGNLTDNTRVVGIGSKNLIFSLSNFTPATDSMNIAMTELSGLRITNTGSTTDPQFIITSISEGKEPVISLVRSMNTNGDKNLSAYDPVTNGTGLGSIYFGGAYSTSGTALSSYIRSQATGNWTTEGNNYSNLLFYTKGSVDATITVKMEIGDNGQIRFNKYGANNITGTAVSFLGVDASGNVINRSPTTLAGYGITDAVPSSRTITINGTSFDLSENRSWTINSMVYPGAGIAVSTGSAWGPSIVDNSTNWNTAFTDRLKWDGGSTGLNAATGRTSLGATTIGSNMFTLTNPLAVTFPRFNADNTISTLSASDMRTALGAGTVTQVNALTIGTTGADISSTVANNTTTPTITLNIPTASATNRGALSPTDWSIFFNKQSAISLTTTGNSGASTLVGSTLNIPNYTLSGLGGEPAITAGTTSQYWRGDKTWQTLNTTAVTEGTNLYFTDTRARNAITLTTNNSSGAATYTNGVFNIPNYTLSGLGGISLTSLSASAPLSYNNGTGAFSITQASTSTNGFLSSTDWNTFNNKLTTEVDGSTTNEGSLTVGAGASNTSIINSNTSGSTGVTITAGTGLDISEAGNVITLTNNGVTSVTGTSPVVSSGGTTSAISLASGYGDTQNPYGTKSANTVLAGPTSGLDQAPTFRTLQAVDIPSLDASKITSGQLPVARGGTGSETQNFVDLTTTQSIGGAKTFTSEVTATRFNPTANTATGTGMFLPAANTLAFSTNGTEKVQITSAGNVGIGMPSITAKLDVNGNINFKNNLRGEITSSGAQIVFYNNANQPFWINMQNNNNTGRFICGVEGPANTTFTGSSANSAFFGSNAGDLHIISNGVIYQTIKTTGNVGIGTNNPASRLVVKGAGNTDATAAFNVTNSSDVSMFMVRDDGNTAFGNATMNNFYRFFLNGDAGTNNTGGIQISRNNTPVMQMGNISGANTVDFEFWNPRNGYIRFGTNNLDRMYITGAGNVGIGTNNPQNRLDVEGAVAIGAGYSGSAPAAPQDGLIVEGNVGIGTSSVTASRKLDVNGEVRIRDLNVAVTPTLLVGADGDGNLDKVSLGVLQIDGSESLTLTNNSITRQKLASHAAGGEKLGNVTWIPRSNNSIDLVDDIGVNWLSTQSQMIVNMTVGAGSTREVILPTPSSTYEGKIIEVFARYITDNTGTLNIRCTATDGIVSPDDFSTTFITTFTKSKLYYAKITCMGTPDNTSTYKWFILNYSVKP